VWFFAKLLALIGGFIWIRGTLPRLRMDQLMNLAWEFILPMALLNMLVAGIWHFMPAGLLRWLVCTIIIAVPVILLGRGLKSKKKLQVRTYQFAE
jgi:NADH-quinone oxidoreductase subunit H